MKPTKLAKISNQLTHDLFERFMDIGLPDAGACVMADTQARSRFVRQGWVVLVIKNKKRPKLNSISMHPSFGAKLP